MKIIFHLGWVESAGGRRFFKSSAAGELFADYQKRIQGFLPCEIAPAHDFSKPKPSGAAVWVCDFHERAKMLSSEDLAAKVDSLSLSSTKTLHIVIGGPDGFSDALRKNFKPDFLWSFGPMTLPHELAAVVASEQIYRAWSILRHQPYHTSH